jgi:Fe-S-cluster-containing dehydrogenase component
MTQLPAQTARKLGLVIDLDTCVGCQACVTACKGWNDQGQGYVGGLSDTDPYGAAPSGVFLNRVHTYQVQPDTAADGKLADGKLADGKLAAQTVAFTRSCLHCDAAPCVTVCPTGASYKRAEDGIVLVNEAACIGCGLCAWACPYGAREMDPTAHVMKKCTLCVDRIYNETLPEEDREPACVRTCPTGARHFGDFADPESEVSRLTRARGGYDLMPDLGTRPTNKYLPPRKKDQPAGASPLAALLDVQATGFAGWLDKVLGKL